VSIEYMPRVDVNVSLLFSSWSVNQVFPTSESTTAVLHLRMSAYYYTIN